MCRITTELQSIKAFPERKKDMWKSVLRATN